MSSKWENVGLIYQLWTKHNHVTIFYCVIVHVNYELFIR